MGWNIITRIRPFVIIIIISGLTSGCDTMKKSFGGGKNAPDEFVVFKRPPLSLPPSYGLRPPTPGKDRPQKISPADEARKAILGRKADPTSTGTGDKSNSRGLKDLMKQTGADKAKPNIRQLVNQETSVMAEEDQAFVNKLIFWVDDKNQPGVLVDAKKENQRIKSNDALGKPITEGETPKVKRKQARKGLLNF